MRSSVSLVLARAIDAAPPPPHLPTIVARAKAGPMHRYRLPLAFLPLLLVAAPAVGDTSPATAPDRFSFQPAEGGGWMRLDRTTGAVSYCSAKDELAVCRLGADERAALESEIARLRAENARLKTAQAPTQAPTILPSEGEFERALGFTERFLRRIMRLFKEESQDDGRL
jgi:hypothetical protein